MNSVGLSLAKDKVENKIENVKNTAKIFISTPPKVL